tara:strand:- start:2668 stop:4809 length:2142 start_codon:yes stop_codon:yes gene_type:complete
MDFFYDKQFRRYIQQFMRLFANFQIEIDREDETYRTVPVRYGDATRMASHILKQNSENVINSAPFISCWIQSLEMSPEARRAPHEIDKVQVYEKKFNYATNTYDNELGDTYQIERHMPVPYNLTMQVDVWTSNTDQKFQLLEQILTLYNPSIDLNSTDNPFDWTRLTVVEMTATQWTNRSIPTGAEDIIDIATLTFKMPVHLTVPARVSRQTLIHNIMSSVLTAKNRTEMDTFRSTGTITGAPTSYQVTTFKDRYVSLSGTTLTLLSEGGSATTTTWTDLLEERSAELRPGISQVKLMDANIESEANFQVLGTLSSISDQEITVTIDTASLPTNSLETATVNNIVDPTYQGPLNYGLPASATGQRYIVTNDVPKGGNWWGNVEAHKNDIIEFTNEGGASGTITVGATYSVNTQEGNPRGITFNHDGTKMFIVGTSGDDINEYSLSVGFDLSSTVTFVDSFSVSSQENGPTAVKFNADGTKMFITGVQHNNVHEYALTTGFDVSTASFTQTLVTTVDTDNFGLDFKPDGTKMYITGAGNDKIYEFNLSTGFDISTATFNQDFNVGNNNDSWASGDWEPFGIEWHPSGTRLFIVGTGGNEVNLYKLSTAWDISTVTYVERYHIGGNPSGLHFSYDGTKMFTVGNQSDLVRSYTLSIPYVFTEYVGGWSLSFDASETSTTKFTTNSNDNTRWVWNGVEWKNAIERIYPAGYWRLYL